MIFDGNLTAELRNELLFKNGYRNTIFKYDVVRSKIKLFELDVLSCQISMTENAEIKFVANFEFIDDNRINYFTDKIRPYMIVNDTEFPLGEYVIATPRKSGQNGAIHVNTEAYDSTIELLQYRPQRRVFFAAGTSYTQAIGGLLLEAGFEEFVFDTNIDTFLTDRSDWEIGESALTIINALLKEINFRSVEMQLNGILRLRRYEQPNALNINNSYKNDELSVVYDELTSETDNFDAYNAFTAVVSSPDLDMSMIATAINDDPLSELSTVSRGRIIGAPVVRLDNIASQEELQKYVDDMMFKSLQRTQTITFKTALMPTHGVGDTIELKHTYISGIFTQTQWSMELAAGAAMTHYIKRVMYT